MNVSAAPPPSIKLDRIDAQAAPSGKFGDVHPDLASYCGEIEQWAVANRNDSRWDAVKFFALKAPAIASSGLAAVFSAKHWTDAATWLSAAAAICVLVDAINPSGQLRNAHKKSLPSASGA